MLFQRELLDGLAVPIQISKNCGRNRECRSIAEVTNEPAIAYGDNSFIGLSIAFEPRCQVGIPATLFRSSRRPTQIDQRKLSNAHDGNNG